MSDQTQGLEQARRLQAAGRIDEAADAYRGWLTRHPPDPRVFDALASMYVAARRVDDAVAAYRAGLDALPDDDMLHVRLALLLMEQGQHAAAATLLRRALHLRPGRLQPLRTLAALLYDTGHYEEALPLMREVVALRPRAADEHVNLARTLLALRAFDEAAEVAAHATTLRPDHAGASLTLGLALFEHADYEQALPAFTRAAELAPDDPRPLIHLGRLHERWRRPDDARTAAQHALDRAPGHPGALRLLARLALRQGDAQDALEHLDAALAAAPSDAERGHILIERGQALDRLERPADACASFLQGQALLAPPGSPVHDQFRAFLDMLERCRDWPPAPVTWPATSDPDHPAPVFLVGFPRSGTTLTEQLLGAHPDFVTSDEQPLLHAVIQHISARGLYPHALADLTDADVTELRRVYHAEAQRRLPAWADAPHRRLVDKQPYNTPHLATVRRVFPDARVVVVLRDPRDACLSLIMQDVAPGQRMISYPTLDAAAAAYERMMGGYLAQRERLGLALHEVRYEDLITDLDTHARALIRFVGAPWHDDVLQYHRHAARRRSQINTHSVSRAAYGSARERWRRYPAAAALTERLRPFLEAFGYPLQPGE